MYLADGDTFLPPRRQDRQVASQESTAVASISMCTSDDKQFWFLLLSLFKNICTSVSAKFGQQFTIAALQVRVPVAINFILCGSTAAS